MSTTAERLAYLNELNAQLNRPFVKVWKESKAALEATIAKRLAAIPADEPTRIKLTESTDAKNARLAKAERKAPATPAKATESLADVLREFNITPKVGRALLRRHKVTTPKAAREFLTARK